MKKYLISIIHHEKSCGIVLSEGLKKIRKQTA